MKVMGELALSDAAGSLPMGVCGGDPDPGRRTEEGSLKTCFVFTLQTLDLYLLAAARPRPAS